MYVWYNSPPENIGRQTYRFAPSLIPKTKKIGICNATLGFKTIGKHYKTLNLTRKHYANDPKFSIYIYMYGRCA